MATGVPVAVCLMYHGLSGSGRHLVKNTGQYEIDFDVFKDQVRTIEESGARTLSFGQLDHREAVGGLHTTPAVCLTFDDGFLSDLLAAEHLASRGMTATFFVTKDRCLSSDDFCSPSELRQIRGMGMSFGTHGTSHRPLTRLSPDEAERELVESKVWLEDVLGEPVDTMAAPGGFLSKRLASQAVNAGYRLIGSSREASVRLPVDGDVVDRVCIRRQFAGSTYARILQVDPIWLLARRMRQVALAVPKRLRMR